MPAAGPAFLQWYPAFKQRITTVRPTLNHQAASPPPPPPNSATSQLTSLSRAPPDSKELVGPAWTSSHAYAPSTAPCLLVAAAVAAAAIAALAAAVATTTVATTAAAIAATAATAAAIAATAAALARRGGLVHADGTAGTR
jgi:hypothetical protein